MNIAIILAGGTGSRMNLSLPKQFLEINNNPIISYTLKSFNDCKDIDKIIVVSLEEYFNKIFSIVEKYKISKFEKIVKNGKTRQLSVLNALKYLENIADKDDIILIHDGVRAMIDEISISQCVNQTKKYECTTLAEKTKNTMVYSESCVIENFLNRNYVYNIQTPQSFKFDIILKSHKNCEDENIFDFTDDTQVAIKNNYKVHIIENDRPNLKLTTQQDILQFEYFLKKNKKDNNL